MNDDVKHSPKVAKSDPLQWQFINVWRVIHERSGARPGRTRKFWQMGNIVEVTPTTFRVKLHVASTAGPQEFIEVDRLHDTWKLMYQW